MHQENIRLIADIIEHDTDSPSSLGLDLDLNEWGFKTGCGTRACIAGYTVAYFEPETFTKYLEHEISSCHLIESAKRHLQINDEETYDLFKYVPEKYANSRPQTAAVLRHFANIGKIDWNITR